MHQYIATEIASWGVRSSAPEGSASVRALCDGAVENKELPTSGLATPQAVSEGQHAVNSSQKTPKEDDGDVAAEGNDSAALEASQESVGDVVMVVEKQAEEEKRIRVA